MSTAFLLLLYIVPVLGVFGLLTLLAEMLEAR